jgi:hypothetical protein
MSKAPTSFWVSNIYVGSTTEGTVFQGNVEGDATETEVFLKPESDGRTTLLDGNVLRFSL